jgi:hypothetical protein
LSSPFSSLAFSPPSSEEKKTNGGFFSHPFGHCRKKTGDRKLNRLCPGTVCRHPILSATSAPTTSVEKVRFFPATRKKSARGRCYD